MSNPWDNDPIVGGGTATVAGPWEHDPIVTPSASASPWQHDPIVGPSPQPSPGNPVEMRSASGPITGQSLYNAATPSPQPSPVPSPSPMARASDAATSAAGQPQSHPQGETGVIGALHSAAESQARLVIKGVQAAESTARNPLLSPLTAPFANLMPRAMSADDAQHEESLLNKGPQPAPTLTNKAAGFVGGAIPGLAIATVAPEAAPEIFGVQGAMDNVAAADDAALRAKQAGHEVSTPRQQIVGAGAALTGYGTGYATGKVMGDFSDAGAGPVERVGLQGSLAIPQSVAGNLQENLINKAMGTGEPWRNLTGEDVGRNVVGNMAFATGAEIHGAVAGSRPQAPQEVQQTKSAEPAPLAKTDSVVPDQAQQTGASQQAPVPKVAGLDTRAARESSQDDSTGIQPVQQEPPAARQPETSPSKQAQAPSKPAKLPPLHPDVHPSVVQDAWNTVAAEQPDIAKLITKIAPLDNYKYPTANASFAPGSGTLRVSVDKPLTPETLRHEFEHVAQAQRGEAKFPSDFNTEEEFDKAMEAPARAKATQAPAAQPPTDIGNGPEQPKTTAAKLASMGNDRESLGLDKLPSPDRHTWQQALNEAHDQGIPDRAQAIAAEVTAKPRPLNDTETAGMVIAASKLKSQHSQLMDEIGKATDPAEIQSKGAQATRLEQEFDQLSGALKSSGTEKGRALASQKLTINKDFNLVSVLNRAKAAKGGDLAPSERSQFQTLTKQLEEHGTKLEALQKQLDDQAAMQTVRRSRPKAGDNPDVALKANFAKLRGLLKAGCD